MADAPAPAAPPAEWPAAAAELVADIEVSGASPEELFALLWGGANAFAAAVDAAEGVEGRADTGWLPRGSDAGAAPPAPAPLRARDAAAFAALAPGRVCRTTFLTPNMGTKFPTTRLAVLREAAPGARFVIEAAVTTDAPYGTQFRALVRHAIASAPGGAASLRVERAMVYVNGGVNRLVKGVVEKGARDGLARNARAALKELQKAHVVRARAATPATEGLLELVARPRAGAAAAAAAPAAPGRPALRAALVAACGARLVAALEPWAAAAHALLARAAPPLRGLLRADDLLAALAAGCLLLALRGALAAAALLRDGAASRSGALAWGLQLLFLVLHVPATLGEALSALALLAVARAVAGAAAAALPHPPARGAPAASGGGVAGAARPAGSKDSELAAGVRFDGYGAAIRSATSGLATPRASVMAKIDAGSEAALEQLRRGLLAAAAPFTGDDDAPRPRRRGGATPPRSPRAHAPPPTPPPGSPPAAAATPPPAPEPALLKRGYAAPELPPAARRAAVVEEVFESERLQPFRGWGSTWPGHFLPTDACLRWSRRGDAAPSQRLGAAAPAPPPGWRWVEEGWALDLDGARADACDAAGWSYGLDFSRLEWPVAPGAGRKHAADFVRRRRWLRTRVPEASMTPSSAPPPLPAVAEGGGAEGDGEGESEDARAAVGAALAQGLGGGAAEAEAGGDAKGPASPPASSAASASGGGAAAALSPEPSLSPRSPRPPLYASEPSFLPRSPPPPATEDGSPSAGSSDGGAAPRQEELDEAEAAAVAVGESAGI
jgi:hypothetical protein